MGRTASRQYPASTTQLSAAPGLPIPGAQRFPGDWIEAWLRLCPDSATVHLGTSGMDWILPAADIQALAAALEGAPGAAVQFNPDAGLVLVPGAHQRNGSSFFRLGR
ncbi:hypothetical protein [Paeniglutamicibacter cryotolerans]|uniref:Uncharacterized protein n=1 Tax=Paeniglutamicibacter cryotolerans TaxID=670079 RepID=A0A839QQB2_9MICC|nr:hypothetical protein [Paeniglutamicibacter cryotolerans]MBB2995442.1 hypothetical protein [Paeniglutamicibacter cryotolerans]